jgi:O-antigen ligase
MLREPGGRAALARVVAGVLIVKGVLGIAVLATTQGANIDGQRYVVHYDAALPMVAGMAIIGFLLAAQRGVPWRKLILLLAGTLVVFSFRRSVWSAMGAAVVVLPLIRMNVVVVRRIVTVAMLGLIVFLSLPVSVKETAFGRVETAVSVAQGTGNEDSAENHKLDLEQGYRIARQQPWSGLGVRAAQRREFAHQEIDRLYVHNDPLQVWLRFGLPGIALFLMLFGVLTWRGVATLRRRGLLSVLDAGCAAFAMVLILAVQPAPFVSDTVRWPILVGLVAAVLRTGATDERDKAAGESSAGAGDREPPLRQSAALAQAAG